MLLQGLVPCLASFGVGVVLRQSICTEVDGIVRLFFVLVKRLHGSLKSRPCLAADSQAFGNARDSSCVNPSSLRFRIEVCDFSFYCIGSVK